MRHSRQDSQNFGSLRHTLRWITDRDEREIEAHFRGNGVWELIVPESTEPGAKKVVITAVYDSIIYLAAEVYGMPEHDEWFEPRRDVTTGREIDDRKLLASSKYFKDKRYVVGGKFNSPVGLTIKMGHFDWKRIMRVSLSDWQEDLLEGW